ncbi:Uncharacterised protein [Serratia liquefaciens]|nr:Uncharacterised protein [Serratia liquefaciens]
MLLAAVAVALLLSVHLKSQWCITLKIKALLFIALVGLAGCSQEGAKVSQPVNKDGDHTEVLLVNSALVDCMGVAPMKCMQVRHSVQGQWEMFYSQIEGFTFEPGYRYRLKVKVTELENVPADASSLRYTLVEQLEKNKV